jgi:hypothetical protein
MNETKMALSLTRSQIKAHPKAAAAEVLRGILAQLDPPPPTTSGTASVRAASH